MFRLSGLLSLSLAVFCGGLLFWTSQSVQRAEQKLSQVSQSNQSEQETLRVLSVEWDYLNRPERLEQLTLGNLDMDQSRVEGKSFVGGADEIPQPVVPAIPRIKPNFLRDVSTANTSARQELKKPFVIQKTDRQGFNKLIESISNDGGEE